MKKLIKISAWAISILISVLFLVFIGLILFFPVEQVKQKAIEEGSAKLDREIKVETAEISFWGGIGIRLGKDTVSNPDGYDGDMLTADNVDLKLSILPLIKGKYNVDRLIINKPEIHLVKKSIDDNNYTFKKLEAQAPPQIVEKATPEAKAAAAVVSFENFQINKAKLVFENIPGAVTVNINDLDLNTTLSIVRDNFYSSKGEMSIASLVVKNDVPLPQLSLALDYQSEFDFSEGMLKIKEADLKINNIESSITGVIQNIFDQMSIRLNMKSDKNSVNDLVDLIPDNSFEVIKDFSFEGDFKLDADLLYDASEESPLTYFGTFGLTDVDASYSKIEGALKFEKALLDFKNDNIRFSVSKGSFDDKPFKAHLLLDKFEDPKISGEISGFVNLDYIEPFLPEGSTHDFSGMAEVDVKLFGYVNNLDSLDFSGSLKVEEGSYKSDILSEPLEQLKLDIYFDNDLTRVNNLKGKTASGSVAFEGRIYHLIQFMLSDSTTVEMYYPEVDGHLSGELNLAFLNQFLPPKGNPDLGGTFKLDVDIAGKLNDYYNLKPSGSIIIDNGHYTDSLLPEPIKHFNGSFTTTGDTVIVKQLKVEFESSDVSFTGKLTNPFPYLLPVKDLDRSSMAKPMFLFKLSSKRFDSDKLFPEAVPGTEEREATVSIDSVSNIIIPDINGKGTFKIDTLIYSKIEFTQLAGDVRIYNRKIDCSNVTGLIYSGTVTGKTTIDMNDFNNPKYRGEFRATQIEADDFASRFSKFENSLFGKIDINGTYSASGWDRNEFLKSLELNSSGIMKQAKIVTSPKVLSQFAAIAEKLGPNFEKEQLLKELKSNIKVTDGKVHFEKLKTRLTSWGDIELDGFYSFDNQISYDGSILLNESKTNAILKNLSSNNLLSGISSIFGERSTKRIKLPLYFSGTIDDPKFNIDLNNIVNIVGDNLSNDLLDLITEQAKPKDSL